MNPRKRNTLAFNLAGVGLFLFAIMGPVAIDRALTLIGL